ncbi:hypothetical protein Hanom_Chr14g01330501 [Helianthus anomalus]
MEVFLGSIATEEYESMASALIEMDATSTYVDSTAFAKDLEKIFSSIQACIQIYVCEVSKSYGLRFPREFALLMKQLLYFYRYTRLLAPNMNMLQDQRITIASMRRTNNRNN